MKVISLENDVCAGGVSSNASPFSTVRCFQFDTFNTITALCDHGILEKATDLCRDYNDLLSKTVEGSDVWNINHAKGAPVAVSSDTFRILCAAERVNKASGGAFNIAVGAASALWHFTDGSTIIPDDEDLAAAIDESDASSIVLGEDEDGQGVVTVPDGMQIDLGGIAKGYIADRVADYLRGEGVEHALLNFGGNVVAIGGKPDGTPWSIGLQNPEGEKGADCWAVLNCEDATIVTSGVYERGFDKDGIRYHHILDPRNGYPVRNGLSAVTVYAHDSMLADALATALFVMGPETGFALAQEFDVSAVFLRDNHEVVYHP